ncbi:MAG: phosphoglucomutase/phosphomannomutase family protein [Pyrinomonadaceae bacterium]
MGIRFGTSGWRAVIADEFTFDRVRVVTNAICRYLKEESGQAGGSLIIGFDSRFMGEKFSQLAAEIAAANGFRVLLCTRPTPTPAISHAIRLKGIQGAMNFTASHNPPEYQGIKFSTSDGAPALPEVTGRIEELIEAGVEGEILEGGSIEEFDPRDIYFEDLRKKIRFDVIAGARSSYAYDPLWGTGRDYLDRILKDNGLEVASLHDWTDVTFGGMSPEPGEKQLSELKAFVTSNGCALGLSTDGDADRFGVVDSDGTIIEANDLIALLTDYLFESRGWREGVARSVATSHQVDLVAKDRGIEVFETPVGFKYIGELINEDRIILGGEESAGLSIKGHYPEKDGILACLLAAEAVAKRGAGLGVQLAELRRRVGTLRSKRIGVRLTEEISKSLNEILSRDPSEIGGRKIDKINRMDGVKFHFEGSSWMLMRPSGTEPMVRIYAESEDERDLEALLEEGRKYLLG